jgi:hypothetical protein
MYVRCSIGGSFKNENRAVTWNEGLPLPCLNFFPMVLVRRTHPYICVTSLRYSVMSYSPYGSTAQLEPWPPLLGVL